MLMSLAFQILCQGISDDRDWMILQRCRGGTLRQSRMYINECSCIVTVVLVCGFIILSYPAVVLVHVVEKYLGSRILTEKKLCNFGYQNFELISLSIVVIHHTQTTTR